MDRGLSTGAHLEPNGLRERNVSSHPNSNSTVDAPDALAATGEVDVKEKSGKEMKTFGRTPDGTSMYNSLLLNTVDVLKSTSAVLLGYSSPIC